MHTGKHLFVENLNLMRMENIKERYRERGREWRLGFFKWFDYVSLRPYDVANGLHLYYILCMIFWMITMCCEVSYLYIELLTQLSYLTYVGFLNIIVIIVTILCANLIPQMDFYVVSILGTTFCLIFFDGLKSLGKKWLNQVMVHFS